MVVTEKRNKEAESLFDEIRDEHFPNLGKEIKMQFHKTQKISKGRHPKRSTPNTLKSNCHVKGQREI